VRRTVPENDARRPRRRLRASAGRFGLFVSKLTPCLGELSREFHLRTLVRDASSAVAAFGCDLRTGPSFVVNLEGENTVCLSTRALTGFQLIVSSFKLGDEISSYKTWSKDLHFLRYFSSPGQSERVFPSGFSKGFQSFAQPRQTEVLFRVRGSIQELTRCVTSAEMPRYFRVSKPIFSAHSLKE